MNAYTDIRINAWMDGRMDGWIDEGWVTCGWMVDGWTDGRWTGGWASARNEQKAKRTCRCCLGRWMTAHVDGRTDAQTGDRQTVAAVRPTSDEAALAHGCGAPGLAVALCCPLGLSVSRRLALGVGTRGDPASSLLPRRSPCREQGGGGRCKKVINRRRGTER